jgi:hypothetical protein
MWIFHEGIKETQHALSISSIHLYVYIFIHFRSSDFQTHAYKFLLEIYLAIQKSIKYLMHHCMEGKGWPWAPLCQIFHSEIDEAKYFILKRKRKKEEKKKKKKVFLLISKKALIYF